MSTASLVLIDGSRGEGGGGMLRTALAMSALTQQPMRLDSVRGGTSHAGLDYEDLVLVSALAKSTNAETIGAELGSLSLSFLPTRHPKGLSGALDLPEVPGKRHPNALVVLNALVPVLARSGMYSQVTLRGETYGHRALAYDYFANVTTRAFAKLGIGMFPDMEKAAFGRDSAGLVRLDVEPSSIHGVDWAERGRLLGCRAMVVTGGLPVSVGARGVEHLMRLGLSGKMPVEAEAFDVESANSGAFVTIWAEFERGGGGATAMGSRGLRIETLAQSAFEELLAWIQGTATVDPYLADQILIAAVLAETPSVFRVSELTTRFLSSVAVIKQFLPIHITTRGKEGELGVVSIRR
jgi:RNA 3'-terminal phosphate cyclase (ATP)